MKQEQMIGVIGNRYQLLYALGAGSMGVVYRAEDRLTGQPVALKRVLLAPQTLAFNSCNALDDTNSLLLALAQEFRILASLRHPNIISVLDYGFDTERRPYFTMELLSLPQTLVQAGQGQPLAVQIDLLVQTLQALAYLHRRGILHRDLKPANVLVSRGQVRVVDFGLAVGRDQVKSGDASGTLLYLAPEILDGALPTESADLYAVGVMAYELLTGQPPFQSLDPGQLLMEILEEDPDLTLLDGLTPAGARRTLPAIFLRLLSKQPALRYPSAEAVIVDLCAVLNQPPPLESVAIRESFLQAATFVGREAEMAQLITALDKALAGEGSVWLIGGESGVGKSRLLDEVRTHALVSGALVLRGQAVEGGGLPYQLWREPLRRLVLGSQVSDLEAGILKPLVPDITNLLQRPIADVAELQGQANQQRLILAMIDLLKRQREPLFLLLEDLQWTTEGLAVLKWVLRQSTSLPLLVLATYRDDERPELPAELPGAHQIKLARLSDQAVAALSSAMLGEAGKQPQVVQLLQRESEGNTFFMVEVVRALAEAAGNLAQIGQMTLPQSVLAGGVHQIIRRKLARIPLAYQTTLQLAAIVGREIDQKLMHALAPMAALTEWLTLCANVAVLEIHEGQWRFAHDKLREQILADLPTAQRSSFHQQVAETIEAVYPDDVAFAETLLEHWQSAGNTPKTVHYSLLVAERLVNETNEYRLAVQLLQRGCALALTLPDGQRPLMIANKWLGKAYEWMGDYEQAEAAYRQSLLLAEQLAEQQGRAEAKRGLGRTAMLQGYFVQAQSLCHQALSDYQQLKQSQGIAACLSDLGFIANDLGDEQQAVAYSQQALSIYQNLNDQIGIHTCLNGLSVAASDHGDTAAAIAYAQAALALARQLNFRQGIVISLGNLGNEAFYALDLVTARSYHTESRQLAQEMSDQLGIALATNMLALIAIEEGNYQRAQTYLQEVHSLYQTLNAVSRLAYLFSDWGWWAYTQQQYQQALAYYAQSISLARQLGRPPIVATFLNKRSWLYLDQQMFDAAQADLAEALALAQQHHMVIEPLVTLLGCAYALLLQEQPVRAAEIVGLVETCPGLSKWEQKHFLVPIIMRLESALNPIHLAAARQKGTHLTLDLDKVIDEFHAGFQR